MKTQLIRQLTVLIALLGFLAIMAGNAFAANEGDGTKNNRTVVISPYWQSDSGSYTFIAVSHTSLSGMASQVGLTMSALPSNTGSTAATVYGAAITFTVMSGTTQRVFIVKSNHPTINSTSIPTAKFISGTSDYSHGSIRVTNIEGTYPHLHTEPTYTRTPAGVSLLGSMTHSGAGWRDPTMLSYWGSVVIEKNTTGFAMEFIGDMNDSQGGYVQGNAPITGIAAP